MLHYSIYDNILTVDSLIGEIQVYIPEIVSTEYLSVGKGSVKLHIICKTPKASFTIESEKNNKYQVEIIKQLKDDLGQRIAMRKEYYEPLNQEGC